MKLNRSPKLKFGLLAVIILEIISIFYLMSAYKKFAGNANNYYKNILASHGRLEEIEKN